MEPRSLLSLVLLLGTTTAAANEQPLAEESITVTVVGTLHTGILAIGGETTGTTITAKGVTWELDLAGDAALREAAEKLDGKKVIVEGTLERRSGVEINERWIVTVTGLRAAGDAGAGTRFHFQPGGNPRRSRCDGSTPIEADPSRAPQPYADILIVDGNPLEDITAIGGNEKWFDAEPREADIPTNRVIMKDGKVHKNTF